MSEERRAKKPSEAQREALIAFMECNLDFANDRFQSADGAKSRNKKWSEISNELNSIGEAVKDAQKWRKYWTDQKLLVKDRQARIRDQLERSGVNGSLRVKPLSPMDERVASIMDPAVIHEDDYIQELYVEGKCETPTEFDGDILKIEKERLEFERKTFELRTREFELRSRELKLSTRKFELDARKFECDSSRKDRELELKQQDIRLREEELKCKNRELDIRIKEHKLKALM